MKKARTSVPKRSLRQMAKELQGLAPEYQFEHYAKIENERLSRKKHIEQQNFSDLLKQSADLKKMVMVPTNPAERDRALQALMSVEREIKRIRRQRMSERSIVLGSFENGKRH